MSQSERTTTDMAPKHRAVMPADLLTAAMTGDNEVLIGLLGLPALPKDERNDLLEVKIDESHSTLQLPMEDMDAEYKLDSATHFGDTVLHLLLAKSHNDLALHVFEMDKSLLKAHNNNLETPLHCAAKVGNEEAIHNLIRLDLDAVRDALGETNHEGDTALHVAAMHGHEVICGELMGVMNWKMACQANKKGFSAFYIAVKEGHTSVVEWMLQVDPTLAFTQFSDGMFPVLVAAKIGNKELVKHFITNYPRYVKFLDPRGRNIYHMAAEQGDGGFIEELHDSLLAGETFENMIHARDYEGNMPLHVAAKVGHRSVMSALWYNMPKSARKAQNKKGQTPFDISEIQVKSSTKIEDIQREVNKYIKDNGPKFTSEWFDDIMKPWYEYDQNKWDRAQIIGLGSVLITTIAFAAAFTIPGGYNQETGIPILGRKYAYKAFTIANTLSFSQGFVSLYVLVSSALVDPNSVDLRYATDTFISAAGCMAVAFALGSYVILAPVSKAIAIIVLLYIIQLGAPWMPFSIKLTKFFYGGFSMELCSPQTQAFQNMVTLLLYIFLLALI